MKSVEEDEVLHHRFRCGGILVVKHWRVIIMAVEDLELPTEKRLHFLTTPDAVESSQSIEAAWNVDLQSNI